MTLFLGPRHVFVLFILCALAVATQCSIAPTPAPAQERPETLTDQLALARICASEVGLTGTAEECAAIYAVLQDRMRQQGWTFLGAARRYSSSVFDRERTDPRAWIVDLSPTGRQPRGWPTTVTVRRRGAITTVRMGPWSRYREGWASVYESAGRVISGEVVPDCELQVHHWGCRASSQCRDSERAVRAGWQEVACWVPCDEANGDGRCPTRNAFWAVPERLVDVD